MVKMLPDMQLRAGSSSVREGMEEGEMTPLKNLIT